jgi:hypothetical protein
VSTQTIDATRFRIDRTPLGCVVAVGVSNIGAADRLDSGLQIRWVCRTFGAGACEKSDSTSLKIRSAYRRKLRRGHKLCGFG